MQLKKVILFLCLGFLACTGYAAEKAIYGRFEKVKLLDIKNITVSAKIDTGAQTSSLSATDIEIFTKKNGTQWVRFTPLIKNSKGKKVGVIERPVIKIAKIKRRAADICRGEEEEDESEEVSEGEEIAENTSNGSSVSTATERPEIEMQLCIGGVVKTVNVNLTDRSSFAYPLLIGTRALKQFNVVVDPGEKFQAPKASCQANSNQKTE